MSKLHPNVTKLALLLFVLSGVSACSTVTDTFNKVSTVITGDKPVRYDNNKSVKDLEVPPDLTSPKFDKAFDMPTGTISASSYNRATTTSSYTNSNSVQTDAIVAKPRSANLSTIKVKDGESYLQINDRYERALLLTEIILERMQFKVVSKIPTTGEINVHYNGANPVFVKNSNYRVTIINAQGVPLVRFAKTKGVVLTPAEHARIVALLNAEFNN